MAKDLAKWAKDKGVKYFMISYTDLFGSQRAKLVPTQAINDMAVDGAGFAGFATWLDLTPAQARRAFTQATRSMPPAEAVSQVVNYYVTEVYETTNVDDRDTYTDNSVVTNVNAEDGAHVDITNDNDTVTASGDGAVAGGEDSDFEGVATGDGAVAAGDDIEGNVNTGTNTGVIGDDADIDDSIFGDGNTQVNDAEGTVVMGDGNVVATEGSQAAGDDLSDDDITIDDSTLNGSNVGGSGNTAVQDNDTNISDDDVTTTVTDIDNSVDNSIEDSFDVEDSFDTDNSVNDSFNAEDSFTTDSSVNDSFTAEDSFNTDASTDVAVEDVEIDL